MSMLIIIMVLAIGHLWSYALCGLKLHLMRVYFKAVLEPLAEWRTTQGGFGVALVVGVPTALVGAIQWWLADQPALWMVFSLLMLLLAWDLRDLDEDVTQYLDAQTDQDRSPYIELLTFTYRHPVSDSGPAAVIKGIFYQALVRWFGVLFWFLVAGAAGAIAFRLAHSMLADQANRSRLLSHQLAAGKRLVALLDLIPAALTTLAVAVVGDFDKTVNAWRRHFIERRRSPLSWDYEFLPEVGYQSVMHGHTLDDAFEHDYEGVQEKVNLAMSLVWRSLICWLTVLAMLILAGWAS